MHLTTEQAIRFAAFAQAAVEVRDKEGFIQLMDAHVRHFIPHELLVAVIGQRHFDHLIVRHCINLGYPDWALAQLTQPINIRERPLLQCWLSTRRPVTVCTVKDKASMSEREASEAEIIQQGRLAIHGLPDLTGRMASYFSFARVQKDLPDEALRHRLGMLVPLLHVALLQAMQGERQVDLCGKPKLTAIEQDLLKWLAAGRSNDEMAQLRGKSSATIRNQLVKLYVKLGVATRAEAVARACQKFRVQGIA